MKRYLIISHKPRLTFLILLFSVTFISNQAIFSQEKGDTPIVEIPEYTPTGNEPKVTVIDFVNESFFESDALGRVTTTMFQSALVESRRFVLVDRTLLTTKSNELNLNFNELTTDQLINICHDLNIKYIVTGSVTEFGIKATGTTVKTKVTYAQTKVGGGLSMEMGKGTARVAVDIKFTDVETKQVPFSTSTIGTAYSKNSIFGLELLLPVNIGTALELGTGVEGFDETLAGKSIRNASRQLINNIIDGKLYNW